MLKVKLYITLTIGRSRAINLKSVWVYTTRTDQYLAVPLVESIILGCQILPPEASSLLGNKMNHDLAICCMIVKSLMQSSMNVAITSVSHIQYVTSVHYFDACKI